MATTKRAPKRKDLGASIDGYLAKVGPSMRPICNALIKTIKAAIPSATSELKWGMPFFCIDGHMICGFDARKDYVRFTLVPGAKLDDPEGVLYGSGHSRSIKIASKAELTPRVTRWIKATAKARQT